MKMKKNKEYHVSIRIFFFFFKEASAGTGPLRLVWIKNHISGRPHGEGV